MHPPIPSTHSFSGGQFKGRTLRFRLDLIQEPLVAKKVQYNGRRQLETLPIVRVSISQIFAGGREEKVDESTVDTSSFLCHVVSASSPELKPELATTPVASREGIFGNLCVTALYLDDLQGQPGLFFVFRDITVLSESLDPLRFSLFDLNSRTLRSPEHAPILAITSSHSLSIGTSSSEPGRLPSTELDRHFLSQGYEILRKRSSSSRSSSSSDPSTGTSTPRSSLSSVPMKRSFAQDSPPLSVEEVASGIQEEEEEDDDDAKRSGEEGNEEETISSSEDDEDIENGSGSDGEDYKE